MTSWSALVVPSHERGKGTGHLKRSVFLVRALRALGAEAFLCLRDAGPHDLGAGEAARLFSIDPEMIMQDAPDSRTWTLIVLDRFRTSVSEFRAWSSLAPVVGIDEGGPCRASFDYLLDLLPGLPNAGKPNLTAPEFLDAPIRRRAGFRRAHVTESAPLRVLVTFGGEDSAGLSLPAALSLSADPLVSVDLLRGPLASFAGPAGGIRVLDPVPDLKERLADYDLVVTQYGLTAFESVRARVPVLLVSPTRYHERLARAAGFPSAGIGTKAASRVRSLLGSMETLIEKSAAAVPASVFASGDDSEGNPLARHLVSLSFPSGVRCPLCASRSAEKSKVLARFPDRTYRRCSACGLSYMTRTTPPPIVYARNYFFEEYKKQYGKTYLEDFPNLERAGRARVRRIASLLGPSAPNSSPSSPVPGVSGTAAEPAGPALLDVGCAYGPFLAAARSEGFSCCGVDPAEDAVRFVRDELGIPAAAGLFPDLDPAAAFGVDSFDAVGMWYVIEHFSRLGAALEAVSRLVRPGGVFAFSTPSGGGVSARVRPASFYENSPADHYSIWEPARTAALLRRFGFRLAKIVVTGHHPERFPGLARAEPESLPFSAAMLASRVFGLGDTFEAYAVKEGLKP